MERLKLENLNLKKFALDVQLQQVNADFKDFIGKMENARPGWHWQDGRGFVRDSDVTDKTAAALQDEEYTRTS